MIEKTYEPTVIEARQYKQWEESGAFSCGTRKEAKPFTILMPPANVYFTRYLKPFL